MKSIPWPASPAAGSSLRILLLYEDWSTAMRVKRAVDRVSTESLPAVTVELTMWKTDLLGIAHLGQLALEDLRGCDVILVSLHGDQEVPGSLQCWLSEWPKRLAKGPTLLAVWLDADGLSPTVGRAELTCLRRAAERWALDWIPNLTDLSTGNVGEHPSSHAIGASSAAVTPRVFSRALAEQTGNPRDDW